MQGERNGGAAVAERWRNGEKNTERRRNDQNCKGPKVEHLGVIQRKTRKQWSGSRGGGTQRRRRAIKPEPSDPGGDG